MAAYRYPCAAGCGKRVGASTSGCDDCWNRVPPALRHEWKKAGEAINFVRTKPQIRADIDAWWAANPPPIPDPIPPWRRHRQEGRS